MNDEKIDLISVVSTWRGRIKAAGKTETQAASESGISTGQLSQYLNGVNTPNITKFEKFENYLRGLGV